MLNVRWDGNLRRHIAKYIHFLNSRRNGNKGVDEMGQKTVDEMGLDEMGCYLYSIWLWNYKIQNTETLNKGYFYQ